jgi:hypothetical protein
MRPERASGRIVDACRPIIADFCGRASSNIFQMQHGRVLGAHAAE